MLAASALAAGPFAVVQAAPAGAHALPACTSNAGCVHITYPDSKRPAVDVPASVLAPNEDINGESYDVCYTSACGTAPELVNGVSLHALLTSVVPPADQINTSSVTYAQISVPGSSYQPSTLRAGELNDPSPFPDGLEPVIQPVGNDPDIEYIRPRRDSQDVNGPDRYQTGSSITIIDLAVHTSGAVVHPTIRVRGTQHINDPLTFSASFPAGDPPHARATFAWSFAAGDPPEAGGRSTTHTYRYNDTYRVSVDVSGTDPQVGAFSGTGSVSVQIGKKSPPEKGGHGGNGKGGKLHPTSGPTKAHGHHQGSSPRGGPTAAPPTVTPTDTLGSVSSVGPSPAATPTATSHSDRPSAPRDGAAFVQGVLIQGASAPPSDVTPTQATRAAASSRKPARPGRSFDARWLWLLLPIGLLAAGAIGERPRGSHRHGPQSRL